MDISVLQAHLLPALAICFAAFMQGITGFGLVIIAAPLLMMFYDPKQAVLIMFIVALITGVVQTLMVWREARYRLIGTILIGYIAAQPFGYWIFANFSATQLKLLVSTILLLSLLLMQFTHHHFALNLRNSVLMGFFSGICGVTTGMAGPPLILYFAYTALKPNELRSTSVVFFLFSGLISVGFFLLNGVTMKPAFMESLYLLPAMLLGLLLARAIIRYVSVKLFRFLIFFMLYFICAYMFYSLLAA